MTSTPNNRRPTTNAQAGQGDLERKSAAVTLSDMEIFIFPELFYGLVLANIMSPRIWRWKEDSWFDGIERLKPYRRITRLKQYIMDHYAFNLDLDTWGLTTKDREIARFEPFIDVDTLKQSNALFGYEGDKYYFDVDIRTHFGLDKYDGDVLPYWKTETVEAMDAFTHKPGYETGAGECVSLSSLYAAALFIVAGIPLKDIYLMATPLHSQNFMDVDDGILTNNRRLVTKNMWFNGTALSAQARRALENERVTIVSHETGFIHTIYDEATISPEAYSHFSDRLASYLKVSFSDDMFGNFLRQERDIQKCFQIRHEVRGVDRYVAADRVFAYEHGSPYRLTDNTRDKLMDEIEPEERRNDPLPGKIILNDLEAFVRDNRIDLDSPEDREKLRHQFCDGCLERDKIMEALAKFCHVRPRLPDITNKRFAGPQAPLGIDAEMGRDEIIERLELIRDRNHMADMAFYAYRDMRAVEPEPFLVAAVQRNPVSVEATSDMSIDDIVARIRAMNDESIYDEPYRLAQPDEVWNYGRGDGLEKAILVANLLRHQDTPSDEMEIVITTTSATVRTGDSEHSFDSANELGELTWTVPPA